MRLTAVELTIERACVSEHEVGEKGIFLLGEDDEWYDLAPGTTIEIDSEDIVVHSSSEGSPYSPLEQEEV